MSFAEFTKANIFDPLQMNNTLFYDDHEKIVKNRAYSYRSSGSGHKKSVLSYANVGATSLFTTVEDLSRWSANFNNPIVGDTAIINTMNTPAVLNNGKKFGGALGQFVGKYKGLNEIQHGGADAGYRSYLTRFPDENFSVIVFSNSAEFNSGRMAHKVVDIYLKDKITATPKKKVVKKETPSKNISISESTLNTYVGHFELQPGFIIQISNKNGKLMAKATGQRTVSLSPISTTEFKVEGVDAKIEFIPNSDKKINAIKLHQNGRTMDAPRVKEFDKTTVNLSDFEGSFYSEELSTTYHFVIVDGKLTAKHSRHSDFELTASKKDQFTSSAWFFGRIKFTRDESNQVVGCRVSSGRVRNLKFKKVK